MNLPRTHSWYFGSRAQPYAWDFRAADLGLGVPAESARTPALIDLDAVFSDQANSGQYQFALFNAEQIGAVGTFAGTYFSEQASRTERERKQREGNRTRDVVAIEQARLDYTISEKAAANIADDMMQSLQEKMAAHAQRVIALEEALQRLSEREVELRADFDSGISKDFERIRNNVAKIYEEMRRSGAAARLLETDENGAYIIGDEKIQEIFEANKEDGHRNLVIFDRHGAFARRDVQRTIRAIQVAGVFGTNAGIGETSPSGLSEGDEVSRNARNVIDGLVQQTTEMSNIVFEKKRIAEMPIEDLMAMTQEGLQALDGDEARQFAISLREIGGERGDITRLLNGYQKDFASLSFLGESLNDPESSMAFQEALRAVTAQNSAYGANIENEEMHTLLEALGLPADGNLPEDAQERAALLERLGLEEDAKFSEIQSAIKEIEVQLIRGLHDQGIKAYSEHYTRRDVMGADSQSDVSIVYAMQVARNEILTPKVGTDDTGFAGGTLDSRFTLTAPKAPEVP